MKRPRNVNSKLVSFIKRWTVPWGIITTLLYLAAIPITVFVFPATTLLLTIFVLFGSFTASLSALGSALVSAEQDRDNNNSAE